MIIVKIQDLPKISTLPNVPGYARVCNSNSTTYLDAPGYEVSLINEADSQTGFFSCKGWDCPPTEVMVSRNGGNCGIGCVSENESRHLMYTTFASLYCNTPCENYENAYRVNKPGEKGYIIGCPHGLELYTSTPAATDESQLPDNDQSLSDNSEVYLMEAQHPDQLMEFEKFEIGLSVGVMVSVMLASIASIFIISLVVGFGLLFFRNQSLREKITPEYSDTKTIITSQA